MKRLVCNSLDNLEMYIKKNKIVCFGAGKKLDEICSEIPFLLKNIEYVLDNNKVLHNSQKDLKEKKIYIYDPEVLLKENEESIILLITSSYKDEILEQLEKDKRFSKFRWIDYEVVFDIVAWGAKKPSYLPGNNNKNIIPKKIHYIWFSENPLPKQLQKYVDGWKEICPDYEIICWNEKNYDIFKHPYMVEAYKAGKWSFVCDYARLDIIYNHGGIYFDTDVELVNRPDELLMQEAFIGFERLNTVNTGSGFGATKGMPIIKELRDNYDTVKFVNHENPNDMVLCPFYETEVLKKHGLTLNGDYQVIDGMAIYPVEYFNAKSLYSNRLRITENTISIHHCSWTWAGKKSKLEEL